MADVSTMPDGSAATDSSAVPSPAPTQYYAGIFPGPSEVLPQRLGEHLARLGSLLDMPVWLLLQGQDEPFPLLDDLLVHVFRHNRDLLPVKQRIALVVNSQGGVASAAYDLARMICRRCGGFYAVIPDAAMSAATLLTLGADKILMGVDAVLGPLDAQVFDTEAETFSSVLNEVQALERLRAYALESCDETMVLLVRRTGKRVETLLPHVLRFVTDSMKPLLDKIDVVHYNERARILKVGEEYAVRLLRPKHPESELGPQDKARVIASKLVESYPEHGFRIDRDEAKTIGLDVLDTSDEITGILDDLWEEVQGVKAFGPLKEEVLP